jgi:putative ABC transport system substrate-binding protein
VSDGADIEHSIGMLGRDAGSGLIVLPDNFTNANRQTIAERSLRHRVPLIHPNKTFALAGALISYGPDTIDIHRRTAGYVDRILKGEKPTDLPVQAPTTYVTVLNLKTAKALGLEVPPTLLARADEVIE